MSLSSFRVNVIMDERVTPFVVRAAYMVEEGSMIVLKDDGHAVVFAVATSYVVSVERQPEERQVVKESQRPRNADARTPVMDSYDRARHDLLDHDRSSR